MKLPEKQREYLKQRIAMALLYNGQVTYVSDDSRVAARRMAETCISTIEGAASSATTVKTAVTNIAQRLEETA